MGYSTDFSGEFTLSRPLTDREASYIRTFSGTRRMKRDVAVLQSLYGGQHGLNGDYGQEGEYFAFDDGNFGQQNDKSIINYNEKPTSQPSLWCGWTIGQDSNSIVWNEQEKFYGYIEWLQYIIDRFLIPIGVTANGSMKWQGEDMDDRGKILVKDNVIEVIDLE